MAAFHTHMLTQLNKTTNPTKYPHYVIFNEGTVASVFLVTTAGSEFLKAFHDGSCPEPIRYATGYCQRRAVHDKVVEYTVREKK